MHLRSNVRLTYIALRKNYHRLNSALKKVLAWPWFFRITLLWLTANAAWIAFSGLYPMAFDEAYHYGLIQLYSDKLTPFWSAMPDGGSVYGAMTRDPSYLFHYLLSFPFRLIEIVFDTLESRVIVLRLICIAFFIGGLYLYRKLLLRAGLSPALTHVVLLLFGSLPIVSLLAAQINYDNLVFLLTPACLLYLQRIFQTLQRKKLLDVAALLKLALLCMLASLVKFSFLPVILAIVIVICVLYLYFVRAPWSARWDSIKIQFRSMSKTSRMILLSLFVVLFGLCFERYGLNTIRYGSPAPDCGKVLTRQECRNFSPWRRNDNTRRSFEAGKLTISDPKISTYFTNKWYPTSVMHLFYALNGPASGYSLGPANTNLLRLALNGLLLGNLLLVLGYYWIRRHYQLGIFLLIAGVYGAVLFLRNYSEYLYLGYPFGIQGRYLLPFLPILLATLGVTYNYWLSKFKISKAIIAALLICFVLTQGGGAATFIVRSDKTWYRSSPKIETANSTVRSVLKRFMIEEPKSPLP